MCFPHARALRVLAVSALALAAFALAPQANAVIIEYAATDSGSIGNTTFGLRLDFGSFPGYQDNLFTFVDVRAVIDTLTETVSLVGAVEHQSAGQSSGETYSLLAQIALDGPVPLTPLVDPSVPLVPLSGTTTFLALDPLSDAGDGAGFASDFNGPLLWTGAGLGAVPDFVLAQSLNDPAWLSGEGSLAPTTDPLGANAAQFWDFNLAIIPEPATWLLLGAAVLALAGRRWMGVRQ